MTEHWNEDLISIEQAKTLDGLFNQRVRRSPDAVAYTSFDRETKRWEDFTWRQMAAAVGRWQKALKAENLHEGERVGMILRNCPEWVVFDIAALGMGLVTVPLYTDDRPDNIAYILDDAAIRLLLVQDAGRWKKLAPVTVECEALQRVLLLDSSKEARRFAQNDERVMKVSDWLPGEDAEPRQRDGDGHALASIVYTSGTTGRPKGVMLSHQNMMSVAHGGLTSIDCYKQDVFLSFLPLSHTLERSGGYYLPMLAGARVAFSRSVAQLANDLVEIRPSVMIAVPRIFERVHGRLLGQLEKQSPIARYLFNLTIEVGWRRFERQQGRAGWSPKLLLWPLLDRLVARKVREKLGGRLRVAVSGGAALSPEISRVFLGLGVPIVQGYGLTETSPVISVNRLKDNLPQGVGKPLRGVTISLGEDDELLVKTPGMMLGYWNNHAATAEMIDADGWLHTGDQVRLQDGHIIITGRLKDILVLSNGEKIPPGDMEVAITLDPMFEQVLVVGEGRPYLSALVVLDPTRWADYLNTRGLDAEDASLLHDKKILRDMRKRIGAMLNNFPGYAKIRRVTLLLEPWTIEQGLVTPTLKLKRAKILERHAAEVEAMYADGAT